MEWRRSSERGLEVEDLGCSEEKSARWVWRWVSLTPAMDHLPFKWWTVGISSSRRELRTWGHTLIGSASAADSFGFMLLLLCEYVSCDVSEKELTVQNIETANRTDRTVREKERIRIWSVQHTRLVGCLGLDSRQLLPVMLTGLASHPRFMFYSTASNGSNKQGSKFILR